MNELIDTAKEISRILDNEIEILPDSPIHNRLKMAIKKNARE